MTLPGASTDCGSASPNHLAEGDALYTWLDDAEAAAGVSDSSAAHLRAALLRTLGASHLRAVRVKGRGRKRVHVSGIVSDAQARCRLRVGARSPHDRKVRADGAFSVTLAGGGSAPVTLLLSDALGRVRLQTLRVR